MNTRTVEQMIAQLKAEPVNTWFDLGLFIDRVRENRKVPAVESSVTFDGFKKRLAKGGIAFISFFYAVDGVTVEVQKYAKAFRNILFSSTPNSTYHQTQDGKGMAKPPLPGLSRTFGREGVGGLHYIAGKILPEADRFIDPSIRQHIIKEMAGFDQWNLYNDFFFTKLQRGSKQYNELISKFWKEVLIITEKLGKVIEKNNIQLLYLINVCSNPGNVSLALSVVLISEYLGIPVINNNHDFYWEAGNRKEDIINKGLKPGPRDFFFTNDHLGEFFSQIEVLYPWESRSWMTVNINKNQSDHVIEQNGHNPANVCEIGTAVDTKIFTTITKRNKIKAFQQVQAILSNYKKNLQVFTPAEVIRDAKLPITDYRLPITTATATATATSSFPPLPVLVGAKKSRSFDFINNNIVFLQPTRLMPRKRIEVNLKLVSKLFENEDFIAKFRSNPQLKLSILVTGPIPIGQFQYFIKLLHSFSEFLNGLNPRYRQRVFLGFLFSEFDKKRFKTKFHQPIDIPELYNIASLILLPSETEGRGLPIIEATACGIPIFCRRYYPEKVYSEVIGEHLEEKDRLKVLDFDGTRIPDKLVDKVIDRVFFPQNYIGEVEHNMKVVQKRYSIQSLQTMLEDILYRLYLQLQPNEKSMKFTVKALNQYEKCVSFTNKDLEYIINTKNRHYLPGFGRLAFMLY
ncbi:MAG: glycosyltransferase, partial [Bacteroidetes bacterium]|nr:glycosyltransferase [Bacteroidota bacterium]